MSYEDGLRQLRDLRKKFDDPVPGTVYHYTSAEGFRGIVTSSELWLTNAAFVNDTTECKAFLQDCARDLLQDKRLENEYVREKLRFRLEDGREHANYYVASFSRIPDSLSQYRGYGKFCIGCDPRKMKRHGFHIYKCAYKASDIKDWVCRKARLAQWDGDCLGDSDKRMAAADLVFAASVKHKAAAYRDEREIRMVAVSGHDPDLNALLPLSMPLVHAGDPPIHFRDHLSYGVPIPYVKFFISDGGSKADPQGDARRETMSEMKYRKLKEEEGLSRERLPITEVWIGPMARQAEAKLACEIMLQERGYVGVQVHVSDIPYRGV